MNLIDPQIEEILRRLHSSYMKGNEYDEGDPIYYRITYRLAEELFLSRDNAAKLHSEYHVLYPRSVSRGFCGNCHKLVTLIPIIYGIQERELSEMTQRESEGRLIIGNTDTIRQGNKVAMFGCGECKISLPEYGTL